MVRIRLQRFGRKNRPYYRIVVIPSQKRREGEALEIIGRYDPIQKEFEINRDSYTQWIHKGAQPSERVEKLVSGQLKTYSSSK
jgi:small subunit ribosomal protein S16